LLETGLHFEKFADFSKFAKLFLVHNRFIGKCERIGLLSLTRMSLGRRQKTTD
jgi:hypothetical protein